MLNQESRLGAVGWRQGKHQPSQNLRAAEVGRYTRKDVNSFLSKEYSVLTKFCGIVAVLIFIFLLRTIWSGQEVWHNISMSGAYIAGTVFSAIAGKIEIQVATLANIKTAEIPPVS